MGKPYNQSFQNNALARFDRYGLPGLVILTLFLINGAMGYYGITAVINSTKAIVSFESAVRELTAEMKERR